MPAMSKTPLFSVMMVTGTPDEAVWSKVGKAFRDKAKAMAKAEKLAEKTPNARFYVTATIAAFKKAPTVCSRTYKQAT